MKFSENTLSILKNFNAINPNIFVKHGNLLSTINASETIFAKADVAETFEVDFAIYELGSLLGALSLFENPEVEFGDTSLLISKDSKTIKYGYADPSTVLSPKKSTIDIGTDVISLELSKDDIASVLKASSVIDLPHVSLVGNDSNLFLKSSNKKNPATDCFTLNLNQSTDKKFEAVILIERLQSLLPGAYIVEISPKGLIHWSNKNLNVEYWTAVEMNQSDFKNL